MLLLFYKYYILCSQIVRILGNQEYSVTRGESLSDELKKHRDLALERARMEADFEVKLSALKKIKAALSKTPDLDIDKVQFSDIER